MYVEYNESGALVTATPEDMLDKGITKAIDSIFYIGLETCSSCIKLHEELSNWCNKNKGTIYYIPSSSINDENLHYIQESTVGEFAWADTQTLPIVYFFTKGSVLIATNEKNTMKNINNHVSVSSIE